MSDPDVGINMKRDSESKILSTLEVFKLIGEHLKVYSTLFEDHLEETNQELSNPYNTDSVVYQQHNVDFAWALSSLYPRTLRASLFVATWSDFEVLITELCKQLQELEQYPLKLNDLAGDGVTRALIYLARVANLKISQEIWEKLKFLNRVRNRIVHSGSQVPIDKVQEFSEPLRKWDWSSLMRISDDGHLTLERDFGPTAISTLQSFFNELRASNTRFAA